MLGSFPSIRDGFVVRLIVVRREAALDEEFPEA